MPHYYAYYLRMTVRSRQLFLFTIPLHSPLKAILLNLPFSGGVIEGKQFETDDLKLYCKLCVPKSPMGVCFMGFFLFIL